MAVHLRVVSPERELFDADVDGRGRPFLICRGAEGELGILPRHAPLSTTLRPGPLVIRNGDEEVVLFVGGGFLEVLPTRVTVLADVAERVEEITEELAENARKRAHDRMNYVETDEDRAAALLELEMAEARLHMLRTLRRV